MPEGVKKSVRDILAEYRAYIEEKEKSQKDKGDLFERLIKRFLLTDPQYANQFSEAWLWGEWPYRFGADVGIDIVAKYADGRGYCAVQCKFYDENTVLQRDGVDSFITASGKSFITENGEEKFGGRIFVFTGKAWGKNAADAIINQDPPVEKINIDDLAASPIDWSAFSIEKPDSLTLKPKKALRPHQTDALDAVRKGFEDGDRGKLIMACGTGKTFTALKIAETLTPNQGRVLFLVPSLFLMSQTLREWTAESDRPINAFAVCSDENVSKRKSKSDEDIHAEDLAIAVTTNAKKLTSRYNRTMKNDRRQNSMTVIFSTYQSIRTISRAQLEYQLPDFDLIICDEAHRTTGVEQTDKDKSEFVIVHDAALVKG